MALPSFLTRTDPHREELLAARAEYAALERTYSDRVDRMQRYRDEANRVRDPHSDLNTADLSDYGRRPRDDGQPHRHRIQLPLGKAVTVKHAFRIAGRLPDVIVDQRDESPFERHRSDSMEKIVWAIMRASKGETTLAGASWNASEIGAGCLDMYWDYKENMPIFRSVDPIGIYEVQGVDDPHDFQRVFRVWDSPLASVQNEYRDATFRGEPVNVSAIGSYVNIGGVDMVRIVQMCDREKLIRFAMGGDEQVVGLHEFRHDYGFVPYVIIPNLGPYEDVWGWADYEFVRALTEYIQLLFSREADVLRAVAAGAYQESGTGANAATIAKVIRDGGVLPVKRESKVEPIQAAEMPNFAEAHAGRAVDFLKMLGFAPDAAWGLPGSGSGTDRGLQLQPLLEYTAMKQLNWQAGLARLFAMGFQMIEKKMIGSTAYRGAKQTGKAGTKQPFSLILGPNEKPIQTAVDSPDGLESELIDLPRSPKELFDGDYAVRFVWRNMVDPDDPSYVLSELNKFQQGVQSLETTLENLGVQAPEDEMRRIEKEADRFPWVRDGMVKMILAQMGNAQGQGGGAPVDQAGNLGGALQSMMGAAGGGASGALDADAGAAALGPGGMGELYGGA